MDKKNRLEEELRLTEAGKDFLENVEPPKHSQSLPLKVDDKIKPYVKVNAIPIPDNATNWDMLKAMFPYAIKSNYIETGLELKEYVEIYLGDYIMRVSYDWLIALYGTEREVKHISGKDTE